MKKILINITVLLLMMCLLLIYNAKFLFPYIQTNMGFLFLLLDGLIMFITYLSFLNTHLTIKKRSNK